MLVQAAKVIAQQFCEETWGKGNLQAIDQLAGPNFQVHYPILPQPLDGEGFKGWVADVHTGFPDLQFTIQDAIAEGDKVAIRWHAQGTHQGELNLLNLPPTGNSVSFTGIIIYHVVDGKVIEERGEEDALGLLMQLGIIPQP